VYYYKEKRYGEKYGKIVLRKKVRENIWEKLREKTTGEYKGKTIREKSTRKSTGGEYGKKKVRGKVTSLPVT
jgi:hypothetical protein